MIFITMCIIAGEFMDDFRDTWIIVLVSMSLAVISFIGLFTALYMIHRQRTLRMEQAVIEESLKYSTRKIKACTWELCMPNRLLGMYSFNVKVSFKTTLFFNNRVSFLIFIDYHFG